MSAIEVAADRATALGLPFEAPEGWQVSAIDATHARLEPPGTGLRPRFEVFTVSACGPNPIRHLLEGSIGAWIGLPETEVAAQLAASKPTMGLGGAVGVGVLIEDATFTVDGRSVSVDARSSEIGSSRTTTVETVGLCPQDDACDAAYWAMLERATASP